MKHQAARISRHAAIAAASAVYGEQHQREITPSTVGEDKSNPQSETEALPEPSRASHYS
jgi:hypothetical protein